MKVFVAGVDGSEPSEAAAKWAADLAEKFGGEVRLVYVMPRLLLPPEVYGPALTELDAVHQAAAEKFLDGLEAKLARPGVKISREVLMGGGAAELLAEVASAPSVEAVVVASTGKGAVTRALVGSVCGRLVQISPKPVLVVR